MEPTTGKATGPLRISRLSRMFCWWIVGTLRKGSSRPLVDHDIYDSVPEFSAKTNSESLQRSRSGGGHIRPKNKSGLRLYVELLSAFPHASCYIGLLYIFMEFSRLCQPHLLGLVLNYITDDNIPHWKGYLYTALLALAGLSYVIFNMLAFYEGEILGMRARAAYSTLIYEKILRLWSCQATTGSVINLLASDVERVNTCTSMGFNAIRSVLGMVATVVLLYMELGWSSLVGLASSVLLLTVSMVCSRQYGTLRTTIAVATDRRVQLMNEIIAAIRVIKMYCWDKYFQGRIAEARADEVKRIRTSHIFKGVAEGLIMGASILLPVVILLTHSASGGDITVSIVFKTMLYASLLSRGAFTAVPRSIQTLGQLFKTLHRIEVFLLLEEKPRTLSDAICNSNDAHGHTNPSMVLDDKSDQVNVGGDVAVLLSNVFASWNHDLTTEDRPCEKSCQLRDINLCCKQGTLTLVAGKVGSGKSSLLLYIAGEMMPLNGHLAVNGTISYLPQHPWIVPGTVRQNVLFGLRMRAQRYEEVLSVCCLEEDIKGMPNGDLTTIGEKGLTLSGGQRARISLARAVYKEADIYLLDDPLSAVDAGVGKHILERCIETFLASSTRILISNQLNLTGVDQAVLMHQGSFLHANSLEYENLMVSLESDGVIVSDDVTLELPAAECDLDLTLADVDTEPNDSRPVDSAYKPALVKDENVVGGVGANVYLRYIQSGGVCLFTTCMLVGILTQAVSKAADWSMGEWAMAMQPGTTSSNHHQDVLMQEFTTLSGVTIVLYLVKDPILWIFNALAAQQLHDTMFGHVMRAPTRFFDTHPVGTVLNIFSRDLSFVDLLLSETMWELSKFGMAAFSDAIVACVVLPWLLIAVGVSALILFGIYRFSVRTMRELKRLEAAGRSPLYTHVSETLNGLQTIRISQMQEDFISRFHIYQDSHTMRWLMYLTACRWMAIMMSLMVALFMILTTILALVFKEVVSPAMLGLSLMYVMRILEPFEFTFRMTAQLDNMMTSVERILSYSRLDQEGTDDECITIHVKWPEEGSIHFKAVSLFYNDDAPAALTDVSFVILPQEKIGIVGRTGSGKSSLLQSLMRLTEPSGQMFIDGIDIAKIPLENLRAEISVIPQDPVLFTGTVRQNLDPISQQADVDLWNALLQVQLANKIQGMAAGLDAEIHEGGSNLSGGQRQLMCLARAILRQNKILVLDEATANIDNHTSKLIQQTIREHFDHCTVLTIAHRLESVMDSDRIMVMDGGSLVQCDEPHVLLQNADGLFYKYVQQTGPSRAAMLTDMACSGHRNRLIKST